MLESTLSMLLRAATAQQAARAAEGIARRLLLQAAAAILAAICAAAALSCALAALWIYAVPRTGPALAAVIVAVVLLCLSGVLLLLVRRRNRPIPKKAGSHETPAPGPLSELRADGSALLVAAVLAGLVLGIRSSRTRKDP